MRSRAKHTHSAKHTHTPYKGLLVNLVMHTGTRLPAKNERVKAAVQQVGQYECVVCMCACECECVLCVRAREIACVTVYKLLCTGAVCFCELLIFEISG
jgi:hypothetical protein